MSKLNVTTTETWVLFIRLRHEKNIELKLQNELMKNELMKTFKSLIIANVCNVEWQVVGDVCGKGLC